MKVEFLSTVIAQGATPNKWKNSTQRTARDREIWCRVWPNSCKTLPFRPFRQCHQLLYHQWTCQRWNCALLLALWAPPPANHAVGRSQFYLPTERLKSFSTPPIGVRWMVTVELVACPLWNLSSNGLRVQAFHVLHPASVHRNLEGGLGGRFPIRRIHQKSLSSWTEYFWEGGTNEKSRGIKVCKDAERRNRAGTSAQVRLYPRGWSWDSLNACARPNLLIRRTKVSRAQRLRAVSILVWSHCEIWTIRPCSPRTVQQCR